MTTTTKEREKCIGCALRFSPTTPHSLMWGYCEPCRQELHSNAPDREIIRAKLHRVWREYGRIANRRINKWRRKFWRTEGDKQSRWQSVGESAANTALGFGLSMLVWKYIAAPMLDFLGGDYSNWDSTLYITLLFTAVSFGRNYIIRRLHIWLGGK